MWTIFAQGTQLIAGVLLVKMLTSQLSLADYGLFALIMAVSAFILTIPFTALQQGFYRYRSVYNQKNRKGEFYSSMLLGVTILISIYVSLAYIMLLYVDVDKHWANLFSLISLFIISEIYKIFTRCIVNADRQRKAYAHSIIVEFVIKCGLLLSLSFIWKTMSISITLIIYALANIISALICLFPHIKTIIFINVKQFKVVWQRVLIFSSPLLFWAGFGWLRDMSMRWFLELHTNTEQVAIFTALSSVALIVPMVIQSVVGAYFIPIMYDNAKEGAKVKKQLQQLINVLLAVGLILFIIIYLCSPIIIEALTDHKYVQYAWALPWMFISYHLFCCGMIHATSLLVDFKPAKLFIPNLLSGGVILFSGLFVIDSYGLSAAIISYCISYAIYFLSSYIVVLKNK